VLGKLQRFTAKEGETLLLQAGFELLRTKDFPSLKDLESLANSLTKRMPK